MSDDYEVKLSRRGFDVLCIDGAQAVYCTPSKAAARIVNEALNKGHITAREAVRLPNSVADVTKALALEQSQ